MGDKSNHFSSTVTPVDETLSTYLLSSGPIVRLYVDSVLYGPDETLPETAARSLPAPSRHARDYVAWHLTRRLGPDESNWPSTARFFLRRQRDDYVFSAQLDGTIVALPK